MAKLTKQEVSQQKEIKDLLKKPRDLTYEETVFVLQNFVPPSDVITDNAAFFTPTSLAEAVAMCHGDSASVVDVGAGIGCLSFFVAIQTQWNPQPIYAIEINPEFVTIGKKLVPQAQWIEGDIFDEETWKKVDAEFFISNPPFGNRVNKPWLAYKGDSMMAAIEAGIRKTTCNGGTVILPQSACLDHYSYPPKTRYVVRRERVRTRKENTCPCCNHTRFEFERFVEQYTVEKPEPRDKILRSFVIDGHFRSDQQPTRDAQSFYDLFPNIHFSLPGIDTCALDGFAETSIITEIVDVEWRDVFAAKTKSGQYQALL